MLEFYRQGHPILPPCINFQQIILLTDVYINTKNHIQSTFDPRLLEKQIRHSQKQLPRNFKDYIDSQPAWEKHLVYNNRELFTSTMNLATNIKLGQQLWLAMDGGTKNAYGSFGWVIANDSFKL
eukprot:6631120-Ditylum_brightwellii.AAC.1